MNGWKWVLLAWVLADFLFAAWLWARDDERRARAELARAEAELAAARAAWNAAAAESYSLLAGQIADSVGPAFRQVGAAFTQVADAFLAMGPILQQVIDDVAEEVSASGLTLGEWLEDHAEPAGPITFPVSAHVARAVGDDEIEAWREILDNARARKAAR